MTLVLESHIIVTVNLDPPFADGDYDDMDKAQPSVQTESNTDAQTVKLRSPWGAMTTTVFEL